MTVRTAMRVKTPLIMGLCVFLSFVSGCCTTRHPQKPPDVDISSVVQQIQKAIDPFWDSKAKGLPPLTSVKIALQTVNDSKISGEVDYLVVALQGYYDNSVTQEVDLTLVPQEPAKRHALAKLPNLAKSLKDEISAAQSQIKAAYSNGAHVLTTQEIDVQLQFAVIWDESAGPTGWKLSPISLTASDEHSKSTTDTITVVFMTPSQ